MPESLHSEGGTLPAHERRAQARGFEAWSEARTQGCEPVRGRANTMSLWRFEVRWADAIGRTLLPRGILGGVVDDVDLGQLYGLEYGDSPWYIRLVMRASLWLTWLAPIWIRKRPRTFGRLAQAEREAVLERLLSSDHYNIRLTLMYFKLTVTTLLIGDPRALARLGAYGLGGEKPPRALRSLP